MTTRIPDIFNSLQDVMVSPPPTPELRGVAPAQIIAAKWPEMAAYSRTGQCWMRSMTPSSLKPDITSTCLLRRWHELKAAHEKRTKTRCA